MHAINKNTSTSTHNAKEHRRDCVEYWPVVHISQPVLFIMPAQFIQTVIWLTVDGVKDLICTISAWRWCNILSCISQMFLTMIKISPFIYRKSVFYLAACLRWLQSVGKWGRKLVSDWEFKRWPHLYIFVMWGRLSSAMTTIALILYYFITLSHYVFFFIVLIERPMMAKITYYSFSLIFLYCFD